MDGGARAPPSPTPPGGQGPANPEPYMPEPDSEASISMLMQSVGSCVFKLGRISTGRALIFSAPCSVANAEPEHALTHAEPETAGLAPNHRWLVS